MLQMEGARAGRTTPEMKSVAEEEGIEIQDLRERIARGEVIIPLNRKHESVKVVGIGSGLRTKVNANIGTSTDYADISIEVEKARVAVRAADIVKGVQGAMDRDIAMSMARKNLNWDEQIKLSIDPEHAAKLRENGKPDQTDVCSMCGEYCAIKLVNKTLKEDK